MTSSARDNVGGWSGARGGAGLRDLTRPNDWGVAEQPGGGARGRPQLFPARQRPAPHRGSSTSANLEGICRSLHSPPTSGVTSVSSPSGKALGGC